MSAAFKIPEEYPRPLAQRQATELLKYPEEVLAALKFEWDLWKLPHQEAPEGDWETWLNIGGRGSGKTTGAAQYVRSKVDAGVLRFNLIGRTTANVRDDMVRGEVGLCSVFPPAQKPEFIASQNEVRFHTGAVGIVLSAEEPTGIQGKNAEISWLDEFSTYGARAEEVWNQVVLATRVGDPKKIVTSNSLPDNAFLNTLEAEAAERNIVVTKSTSFDNFANLPPAYQREVRKMMRTAWGRAWVLGQKYRPEGALWKEEWFRYIPEPPGPGLTVVGVDPSGTDDGDETGIVVARRCGAFGYVLEDLSGHHDPEVWPKMVVDAARRHGAKIVIERNRGLNFLRALIKPLDRTIPLEEIYSRGQKQDRAHPVANLYELRKIFHCGKLTKLEQQLTSWDPKNADLLRSRRKATSPDRMDALVFAISKLGFHLGLAKYKSLDDAGIDSDYSGL